MPSLLKGGMLLQFLELTSAFVIPLLTLFIVGRFTRVHRASGTVGLLVGAAYGILRLFAPGIAEKWGIAILPSIMVNTYAAYPFSMLITAAAMLLISAVIGWQPRGETVEEMHTEREGWLRSSQEAVQRLKSEEGDAAGTGALSGAKRWVPVVLTILVVALGCFLSFVLFW